MSRARYRLVVVGRGCELARNVLFAPLAGDFLQWLPQGIDAGTAALPAATALAVWPPGEDVRQSAGRTRPRRARRRAPA